MLTTTGHPELRSKGLDSKPMIDFQPIDLTYQGIGKTSLFIILLRDTFKFRYNVIMTSFEIKAPNVLARSDVGFPFLVPLSKPILKGIWDAFTDPSAADHFTWSMRTVCGTLKRR